MNLKIAPSILSSDFARLADGIAEAEGGGADWIHVDVMDGHFVPNLTLGPPVVAAIRKVTDLPLDVHLMIADPDRYVDAFADAGADILTVHQEAATHLHRTLDAIRQRDVRAGVSINPATPTTLSLPNEQSGAYPAPVSPSDEGGTMPNVRRGVFRSRTLTAEGHPYLIAVTSDRRVIQRVTVYPWDDEAEMARMLTRHLNQVDPPRRQRA
ncbi:MAG TPA: ribulose-phosphate 3-epimerase [Longimicrobiales bacterium]|nr:ribulose-phosphate 3-epimerase [Longimicrobiales bacterium]